ncbi:MAG: hypothetical protein ACRDSL_02215 [Pseudonocardiaceae bacterium]
MVSTGAGLAIAVFLAAAVEFIEAFTIVLAIGVSRGWRAAVAGTVAALTVLAVATAAVGPALARWVPETLLQLVVGVLLLVFGAQWLRKAVLRSAGLKAKHDEDATFRAEQAAAEAALSGQRFGVDGFGFVVAFKGVLLEGLEVVVIVVLLGASAGRLGLAAAAAGAALVAVLALGVVTYRPLSRIPENTLAFGVGLLLITFGTFWAVEGLGVFAPSGTLTWPGGDLALIALLAVWTAGALASVQVLRTRLAVAR